MQAVTDATFTAAIANTTGVLVVDFWADWCSPCKKLAPILEELAEAHPEATFVKMDAQNETATATRYGVAGLPAILFINAANGEVLTDARGGAATGRNIVKQLELATGLL